MDNAATRARFRQRHGFCRFFAETNRMEPGPRQGVTNMKRYRHQRERDKIMVEFYGIGGFLVLLLDIWAIISIVGSSASTGSKVLWVLLILLLPVLGFIIWLIAGPRANRVA